MLKNSKIFVAGHRGLVGSAIVRNLESKGYSNVVTRTRKELDLLDRNAVDAFFKAEKPEYAFLAAAKVGGILANRDHPADFIYENLAIELNVIDAAYKNTVKKLLFLGSSCIYPKFAPQPMKEECLLTSALEPTNEPYAIAKIAGIKLCQSYNCQYGTDFIACMPTNLYGPRDNFDLTSSHVLPAMIRKFHEAKESGAPSVTLWGDGTPFREFLYVDDMADASVFMMETFEPTKEQNESGAMFLNVGTGEDATIKNLAETVKRVVGFEGGIAWDVTKPNGTPKKLLDVSKLHDLGWRHSTELEDGIRKSYAWFLENRQKKTP